MTQLTVAELTQHVGKDLGHSEWFVVDQQLVDKFSEVAHDPAWIHNDPEKASNGPFGGPVAQGLLTLALIPHLLWQTFDVTDSSLNINYGFNRCRFPGIVLVDRRIRGNFTLAEAHEISEGVVRSVIDVTVEVESGDRPVCVAQLVLQHHV